MKAKPKRRIYKKQGKRSRARALTREFLLTHLPRMPRSDEKYAAYIARARMIGQPGKTLAWYAKLLDVPPTEEEVR